MKKLVKILFTVLAVVIIGLTAAYVYYGGFKTVHFEEKETGGELFVYEDVIGDYNQSPVYMDSVYYSLIHNFNIETTRGAGLYFDNPQDVEKSKLRSRVGCLLDTTPDSLTLVKIRERHKVEELPRQKYIVTEFPHRGTMSVFVGLMKVYPAMNKYLEEKSYKDNTPVMEIYDVPSQRIIYRKAVSR